MAHTYTAAVKQDAGWWILFGGATAALIATDHITSRELPNTADQLAISRDFSQAGAEYTILPVIGVIVVRIFRWIIRKRVHKHHQVLVPPFGLFTWIPFETT